MTCACAVALDPKTLETERSMVFWADVERDLKNLRLELNECSVIVAYNAPFDLKVAALATGTEDIEHWKSKVIDPCHIIGRAIGVTPSLAEILDLNGFSSKTGASVDAPTMWKRGERARLAAYCLADARLTAKIFAFPGPLHVPTLKRRLDMPSVLYHEVGDSRVPGISPPPFKVYDTTLFSLRQAIQRNLYRLTKKWHTKHKRPACKVPRIEQHNESVVSAYEKRVKGFLEQARVDEEMLLLPPVDTTSISFTGAIQLPDSEQKAVSTAEEAMAESGSSSHQASDSAGVAV